MLKNLIYIIAGGACATVALELFLHASPLNLGGERTDAPRFSPITAGEPNTDFTFSRDWNFIMRNEGHINSDGFHSDEDYPENGAQNISVVIGDSFIEGSMIPHESSIQSVLNEKLENRVVSLGVSDADLGTYLYFAKKSVEVWGVKDLIFIINENDIANANQDKPGRAYIKEGDKGCELVLPEVTKPTKSKVKQTLRKVRLTHYVMGQLRLWPRNLVKQFKKNELERPWFKRAEEVLTEGDRPAVKTIDYFLSQLKVIQDQTGCRIVCVVNGDLENPFGNMENHQGECTKVITAKIIEKGFNKIDAYSILQKMAKEEGLRPRWMNDHHWTPAAHREIAKGITETFR